MQDNNQNYQPDTQFEDMAWGKMSQMLDRDLPVTTQNNGYWRRYGILLLVLMIGFMSGIGTMYFVQNDKNEAIPEPVQHTMPEKMANTPQTAFADPDLAEPPVQIDIVKPDVEQEIQEKIETAGTNINKITKRPTKNNNIYDSKLYTNSSSVLSNSQNENQPVAQSNFGANDFIPTNLNGQNDQQIVVNDIQKNESSNNFVKRVSDNLQPLPTKNIEKIDDPYLKLVNLPEIKISKVSRLSYGLYLGTQTRDFSGSHGWVTNLNVRYQLDDKFGLRTGLGFSKISGFQSSTFGINEPLTPEYFEPLDIAPQSLGNVDNLESNQDLPLQHLSYLDIPIALDYRMSDNLGILMGVKLSRLLSARMDGFITDDLSTSEVDLLDEALFNSMRKVDVATVLGVGFYPTDQVGVEFKYNHGLIDYTIDQNWHIRQLNTNKSFELGIHYIFR